MVTMEKFSKWIEACPITNLRVEQAVSFFTDIIHQFGVPNSIITDNDSQFTGRKFQEFCDKYHIHVDWAAITHLQTNGQLERANDMILQGLKPRIFDRLNKSGQKWLQELPSVVWSLRTTPSRATGFTLFFLVYGAKVVLPTDLEYRSPRAKGYDENANQRAREDSLDQLDEARTVALMHSSRYQQALRRHQAQKIRHRDFDEGDLVLRLRQDNRGRHKLSPPWEGPYVVVKVLKPGTYKLENEDDEELTKVLKHEEKLTIDLLPLRLEGGARSGNCMLQLEDDIVLFLTGLPHVLVGHALLDQLPREQRDLLVSKLEGSPRRLQCGALPLELALRFLPGRALALEGSLGLLEGGLLLLEPSLCLLARALLLAKLLPTAASEATSSARSAPSCSASLAFSSA
jgi:hypothetical protein